jgi:DNA-binding NarL/FixJ family response regulator
MERSSIRVLVVEDSPAWRQFSCSILRKAGIQVIGEASDGFEGVQKAQEQQPDLILLDIGLPSLNGMEVGKEARKLAPGAKILFVSQETSTDLVREALSLGAQGYVQKSNAGTELLFAIETVLAGERYLSDSLKDYQVEESTNFRGHHHEILFFADDEILVHGFAHFVGSALNAGNPALVLATESHRASIFERLKVHGVDVDAALQKGTCVSLDAAEDVAPARFVEIVRNVIEAASKARKTRHPRIAFCGERAGSLWAQGKTEAAIQLERFCEDLITRYDIDILCGYPFSNVAAYPGKEPFKNKELFHAVCATHSLFIPMQQPAPPV